MTDKLRERVIEKAEELGWTCASDGNEWAFYKFSPAGEDFGVEYEGSDVVSAIHRYADDFDTEEHITMWVRVKDNGVSGVPSIKELCQDADDIQEMLNELAEALEEAEQEMEREVDE